MASLGELNQSLKSLATLNKADWFIPTNRACLPVETAHQLVSVCEIILKKALARPF
jgi:hypothetical protein